MTDDDLRLDAGEAVFEVWNARTLDWQTTERKLLAMVLSGQEQVKKTRAVVPLITLPFARENFVYRRAATFSMEEAKFCAPILETVMASLLD
jgi:hypothetical protein